MKGCWPSTAVACAASNVWKFLWLKKVYQVMFVLSSEQTNCLCLFYKLTILVQTDQASRNWNLDFGSEPDLDHPKSFDCCQSLPYFINHFYNNETKISNWICRATQTSNTIHVSIMTKCLIHLLDKLHWNSATSLLFDCTLYGRGSVRGSACYCLFWQLFNWTSTDKNLNR